MTNLNIIRNITLALGLAAALPLQADELLPQQHYADELNRCVAAIRDELGVTDTTPLQHRVTEIGKHSASYAFHIETATVAEDGSPATDVAETDCSAGRFDDSIRAEISASIPPQQLAGL